MPLDAVLQRFRAHALPRPAVALFDLDSTLFSTQERNLAILREYAAASSHAHLRSLIAGLEVHHMGWNVVDDLKLRGFDAEDVLKELRRFWFERFFHSSYLHHDQPLPGAAEFVRALYDAGAVVVYLTGRDAPKMGEGTRKSLGAHGFPIDAPRTHLLLKPKFEEQDLAFKRRAVAEVAALGEVLAAFENEPVNANLFAESFPAADVLFLETVHSPGAPPLDARIVRVRDFQHRR